MAVFCNNWREVTTLGAEMGLRQLRAARGICGKALQLGKNGADRRNR